MQSVLKLTRNTKVPAGLKSILQQTFECSICLVTPIVPPVIATKCCKNILGCQTCADRWYAGEAGRRKLCPLCKHERGFAETNRFHGLDDFLKEIKPLFEDDDDELPRPLPALDSDDSD